jgi:hypothetical protein
MITEDKKSRAFKKKCLAVDNNVMFIATRESDDEFEDDGTLHVVRHGTRAVFDVSNGQTDNTKAQNEKTRQIMKALGAEKKLSSRVLMDESEDEDEEVCECCGRPL